MIKFLKWVRTLFWCSVFVATVASIFAAVVISDRFINVPMLPYKHSISNEYPAAYKDSIEKSRYSAVRVISHDSTFLVTSSSTGTYFKAKGKYYVITTEHGIFGGCPFLVVEYDHERYQCKKYVKMDRLNDYAIIEIEGAIPDRKPINIPEDLPRGSQWRSSYSILNKIVYTGYPNSIGPLTLRGEVVGYADSDYLYVFSYAYGGASGAGVFSTKGKYIGLVNAIDVGQTEFGIDILENVVLVTPVFKVDWSATLD
jgi:hypothetical protein|tara:strand:+ start:783 stop:1550 length:768 start_codon:yes stop_codon:yes gene_type:complete